MEQKQSEEIKKSKSKTKISKENKHKINLKKRGHMSVLGKRRVAFKRWKSMRVKKISKHYRYIAIVIFKSLYC